MSAMNLTTLLAEKYTRLYQEVIDGERLEVKETTEYRWFEYGGGQSVQSLMNKAVPEKIVTPVSESLLLFLLFQHRPLKVLNLGLGGGTIDRALAQVEHVSLTSVEASQAIINMAQQYFHLPEQSHVNCQNAERFIQQTDMKFDTVICDLFIDDKNPDFLFTPDFYKQLQKITSPDGVVMINMQVDSNEALLPALLAIREHFSYVALIEFDDYKNIVIMCSSVEIPSKEALQASLSTFTDYSFTYLDNVIEKIYSIPVRRP